MIEMLVWWHRFVNTSVVFMSHPPIVTATRWRLYDQRAALKGQKGLVGAAALERVGEAHVEMIGHLPLHCEELVGDAPEHLGVGV